MKIYKIIPDVDNYQWVMPKNESDLMTKLSFDCEPKKDKWQPVDMFVFNPKKKKGNFYSLGGIGALVCDEKALDVLLTSFEMAGEVLALKLGSEVLYVINVLQCTNALDYEKSKWSYYSDGTRGRLLQYAFYRNRLTESSIFKIPETSRTEIFTYSGTKDPEDDFLYLYHANKLEGLLFEEVYSQ